MTGKERKEQGKGQDSFKFSNTWLYFLWWKVNGVKNVGKKQACEGVWVSGAQLRHHVDQGDVDEDAGSRHKDPRKHRLVPAQQNSHHHSEEGKHSTERQQKNTILKLHSFEFTTLHVLIQDTLQ